MKSETLSDFKRAGNILESITARTTPMGAKARSQLSIRALTKRRNKSNQLKKRTCRRRKSHINKKKRKTRADYKDEKKRMAHVRSFIGRRR